MDQILSSQNRCRGKRMNYTGTMIDDLQDVVDDCMERNARFAAVGLTVDGCREEETLSDSHWVRVTDALRSQPAKSGRFAY